MDIQDICNNWEEIPQTKKPIWFWIVENIQKELSATGTDRNVQVEVLQSIKHESLKELNLRGDMRNLQKRHIPRIKEMYGIALQKYVIQE